MKNSLQSLKTFCKLISKYILENAGKIRFTSFQNVLQFIISINKHCVIIKKLSKI